MGSVSSPNFSHRRLRKNSCLLALCWICGLTLGLLTSIGAGTSLSHLMRGTLFGTVSIVSLLYMMIFPFLISAAAVLIIPSALYLLCFGKAFLFAFVTVGISRALGSGGWLPLRLVLFSDCMVLPLLYFLWLRLLGGKRSGLELVLLLALAALVVSVDYRIISPYLASLIKN